MNGMTTQESVLEILDLRLEFPTYRGSIQALNGVSLEARAGEIVGVVGESGCAKSVTVMAATRLLPRESARITGGSVRLLGREHIGTTLKQG